MKKLFFLTLLALTACNSGGGGSSSGGAGSTSPPLGGGTPSEVRLNAFTDFDCTSNWTNRDGALGLKAHSGNGTCQASFPGVSGNYRVSLKVQAERDGASHYRISINSNVIKEGNYPYATGSLACDCPANQCPDTNKMIDAGVHRISKGDTVKLYGEDTYPCGHDHGAYAKWHEMIFSPN